MPVAIPVIRLAEFEKPDFFAIFIAKTSYSLGFRLKKEMKILYDKTIHIIS